MNGSTNGPPRLGRLDSLRFLLHPQRMALDIHRRHGGLARLADAAGGMTLVFEPEDVRAILTQTDTFEHLDQDTAPIRLPPGSASYRLTSGLLSFQNGDRHRTLRRELMPAFDVRHLQDYFRLSRDSLGSFLDGLGHEASDLNRICHELAMDTALLTLFGLRPGPGARRLSSAIQAWLRAGFSPWTLLFPRDLPGTSYRAFLRHGETLEALLLEVFREGPQIPGSLVKVVFGGSWKRGEPPPELVSRASGYMQASYETTANTLFWTLVMLNLFPEAAARVLAELDEVLGDREIQYDDLASLGYLRAVILESMRLLPPLALSLRRVSRAVTLGGREFAPGDKLVYGPLLTHRLPHVFARPGEFDPARFLKADKPAHRADGFLAFGGGPRRCPGEAFGLNESLLILAEWLRRAFPRIPDGATLNSRGLVILTPSGPVPFRNQPRKPGTRLAPHAVRLKGGALWGIG